MDQETQKIIAEQMKTLPKDVLSAIVSVDYKTKLQEITHRQKLLIDQAGQLEIETTLVMIGLEPLSDFVANLQKGLNVPLLKAKEVAIDVSENIFKPIRESLQAMDLSLTEPAGDEQSEGVGEEEVPRFTNSSEIGLNRDQILKEIEDPSLIDGGDTSMKFTPRPDVSQAPATASAGTQIEIRPNQGIEIPPGSKVKDVPASKPNIKDATVNTLEAKLTGTTMIQSQVVNAKPEIKLPEIEKKRPTSGVDPYREPLS
jgi:hypothetical protein